MHRLKKIDDWLGRMEARLIVVLLSGLIVLSFTQIVMRNFFHSGLNWGDVLMRHGALWIGLLGASLATKEARHLSIEFASHLIPQHWARSLATFIKIFASTVCAVLTYYAYDFVNYEQEGGAILIFEIPTWLFQIVIPYSFAVICFRFLLNATLPAPSALKKDS